MIKKGIDLMYDEAKKEIEIKDIPYKYHYRFSDNDYQRVLWHDSLRWGGYPQWRSRTERFNILLNHLTRASWRTIVC